MISNHYNKITKELYKDAKRRKVFPVSRFISSDGDNRKPVMEVLAIYDKNYVSNKRFK